MMPLLRNGKIGIFDPPPNESNANPYKCLLQCKVLSQSPDPPPLERYVIKERSLNSFVRIKFTSESLKK
jgi:hypothetical protein